VDERVCRVSPFPVLLGCIFGALGHQLPEQKQIGRGERRRTEGRVQKTPIRALHRRWIHPRCSSFESRLNIPPTQNSDHTRERRKSRVKGHDRRQRAGNVRAPDCCEFCFPPPPPWRHRRTAPPINERKRSFGTLRARSEHRTKSLTNESAPSDVSAPATPTFNQETPIHSKFRALCVLVCGRSLFLNEGGVSPLKINTDSRF
jgi:hypothetical protein